MLSVIQAQQLHSYSAAYCQRSTQQTPASSKPLHLHAEPAASNVLCAKMALGLACTVQVTVLSIMPLCLSPGGHQSAHFRIICPYPPCD